MKTLSQIANDIFGAKLVGDGNVKIIGVTHDSRQVVPGMLFAALKGSHIDGTKFVEAAIQAGAVAILCEDQLAVNVPQLIVENPRDQLGFVAAACFENPSSELALVGITGTNGKTTITYIVESVLNARGYGCGVMGTVEYRYDAHRWDADFTTPEASMVQSTIRKMVDAGATHLAMEVSSHGLSLGRVNGCEFDVAAFTNLTQDHLDFHHSMQQYGVAKMQLFTKYLANRPQAKIVLNMDDPFAAEIRKQVAGEVIAVSTALKPDDLDLAVRPVAQPKFTIDGIEARLQTPCGEVRLQSELCGPHNFSNLLVAFGICLSLGLEATDIAASMTHIRSVPGRLERVDEKDSFSVFVDYAHTPDALVNVLRALRPLTKGRLICIFGCGGDRDGDKRPLMGAAVAQYADIAVVTSDNPRTESPGKIIDMVLPGVCSHKRDALAVTQLPIANDGYISIEDRRDAIQTVIASARARDTVLIAGKGHEDYVIVGTKKFHFDDREEARLALAMRKG